MPAMRLTPRSEMQRDTPAPAPRAGLHGCRDTPRAQTGAHGWPRAGRGCLMARIRSIKPELRTSMTVAQWPREVRYFWVLLWGYLDDHGYGPDEPRVIKADCFPLDDDVTVEVIGKWLEIMATTVIADGEAAPLCRFTSGGRRYLHAPKWSEHQRPQHPALPRFPACRLSHEIFMNGSHESHLTGSGEPHETNSAVHTSDAITPGKQPSGDSHESLTPEGEQVVEQGGGGVAREARSRKGATILGNAILDEHRRLVKPSLPRDVTRRLGDAIEDLLDDPAIIPDAVRAGLAKMRANPKLGPGVLSSLVHEIRQVAAHPELAQSRASPRQQAEQAQLERAMQRAIARGGNP